MQWIVALLLLVGGIYLSAFFSGTETGFYRVSRIRLELDARGGDRVARHLLRLVRRPAMFVATTLVGNNLANYLTTLATVYLAQGFLGSWWRRELVATLLLTPLVFVYGELIPKSLHFGAPGRLLRRRTGLLSLFSILFLPASLPLAGLTLLLARLTSRRTQRVETLLGRRRLEELFQEGHEEGLLTRAQRQLVQGLLGSAAKPVTEWLTPMGRTIAVRVNTPVREVLRLARRQRLAFVPVCEEGPVGDWVGYVNTSDLAVRGGRLEDRLRPLVEVTLPVSCLQVLEQLYHRGEELALVKSAEGNPLGIVSKRSLGEALFRSTS